MVSKQEENCLSELKQLIRESDNEHLKAVVNNDEYLRTFVVGRKYNVNHAFDTAKGHMNARHGKYRELYSMPPSSVRHVLESGFFGVLKNRDPQGRLIGFMRIPKLDIKTMEFDDIFRAAVLIVDSFWYDRTISEKGQIFIVDYSGYNLSIFTKYSFNQKLNFALLFLNNYPTRFKEAHIYNNPRIVSYTYSLIKPFLPEKLRKRIFLHGHNRALLHDKISPDILPQSMGGNLTDEEAIDFDLVNKILSSTAQDFCPAPIKIMD
jgi:hypothetical protein